MEDPDKGPHSYSHLILTKGASQKHTLEKRQSLQQVVVSRKLKRNM
jgi:hypothetical protein